MEEVSVAPTKKRVCLDKAGGWVGHRSFLRIASEMLTTFQNLFFFPPQVLKRFSGVTSEVKVVINKTQVQQRHAL